ncbi:hypothetical protein FEM48_Zijuj02G0036600 [Ziziphus jujuba var. spinosa]|uniref:Uncharacterized protein n=1 Tax=Ziziphus jujuba var. spinosa TaxID=714518 RepID=A0A978VTE7_ZIZJJ|nr:hypothetical protein FEM48_Zijuj02G0036600 [Ziziphus jujuba var. spinosa]
MSLAMSILWAVVKPKRLVYAIETAIVVVMSLAMGIIWVVVKAKRPQVVVGNGYIVEGTRNISKDNTTLSGLFKFGYRFYNPKKKATIHYDTLDVTSSFSDETERHESLNEALRYHLSLKII